jgi:hypothetical protein
MKVHHKANVYLKHGVTLGGTHRIYYLLPFNPMKITLIRKNYFTAIDSIGERRSFLTREFYAEDLNDGPN